MKATLIGAALLVLPAVAVATVAMEPQRATQPHEQHPARQPLFTVTFVLRQPLPEQALPAIAMDPTTPEIVPPAAGSVPAMMLGALHSNPNAIICYGRGCESDGR